LGSAFPVRGTYGRKIKMAKKNEEGEGGEGEERGTPKGMAHRRKK